MQLETLVQQQYNKMSASDRQIWQYICRNRERCRGMSLHELADACQVSHTTVLRFLQLLGMDGYSEFKVFLKWDDQRIPVIDVHSVEKSCFDLSRSMDRMQEMDCTQLFRWLDEAENIYAYGSGSIQKSAAKMMKSYFLLDEKLVNIIEGREERGLMMQCMHPGDVVFLLSVSGNNASLNDYAVQLRKREVHIVAVCQDGANALSSLCDFQLSFYTQKIEVGSHGLSYFSSAGMFIIVETLALKYAAYRAAVGG